MVDPPHDSAPTRTSLALLVPIALVLAGHVAQAQSRPAAKTVKIDAPSIGRQTAYNVILPDDYETSGDKRYPVLYLLHGLTGNYTNWAGMGAGRAARGLDLIVVMPDGGNSCISTGPRAARARRMPGTTSSPRI